MERLRKFLQRVSRDSKASWRRRTPKAVLLAVLGAGLIAATSAVSTSASHAGSPRHGSFASGVATGVIPADRFASHVVSDHHSTTTLGNLIASSSGGKDNSSKSKSGNALGSGGAVFQNAGEDKGPEREVCRALITVPSLHAAVVGSYYSQTLTAENGATPYTWSVASGVLPPGLALAPSTGLISGTPTVAGTYTFNVRVSYVEPSSPPSPPAPCRPGDDDFPPGPNHPDQVNGVDIDSTLTRLSIKVEPGPIEVVTSQLSPASSDLPYAQTLVASGDSGGPFVWSLAPGSALPSGLSLSPSGLISGTPTGKPGVTSFTVDVHSARVPRYTASKELLIDTKTTFFVSVSTLTLPNGVENQSYDQQLTASGGSGTYTWSLASGSTLPPGLELASDGKITGTPTTAGIYGFSVDVKDTSSPPQTATGILTIQVEPVGSVTITTSTLPAGTVGTPYDQTLQASGGSPPYTWSLASGSSLPAGLALSPNGQISGQPQSAGTTTFTVDLTDNANHKTSAQLSITVGATTLSINHLCSTEPCTDSLPSAELNVAYSGYTLQALGGTTPYTWTVSAGALPSGMELTSAGVVQGTPTQTGTFDFTAQVTDKSGATATQQYELVVNAPPLSITTTQSSVEAATYETAYNPQVTFTATGGNGTYTWSATGLPQGMSLSSGGVLSGTPTQIGTFSVNVQVQDSESPPQTASALFTLKVNPLPLEITTTSLPGAKVGTNYDTSLGETGGVGPYTWQLAPGAALPSGLTLQSNGVITGAPTSSAVGTTSFTVLVTDGENPPAEASRTLSITVSK